MGSHLGHLELQYNSDLYGLPKATLEPLQRVQISAALLVSRTRKHESITHVLADLHWLPVQQRIKYKILLLVFKNGMVLLQPTSLILSGSMFLVVSFDKLCTSHFQTPMCQELESTSPSLLSWPTSTGCQINSVLSTRFYCSVFKNSMVLLQPTSLILSRSMFVSFDQLCTSHFQTPMCQELESMSPPLLSWPTSIGFQLNSILSTRFYCSVFKNSMVLPQPTSLILSRSMFVSFDQLCTSHFSLSLQ